MKILAPVNKPQEVALVAEAGCNEIYCGVLSKKWKEKYTNVGSINRREWKSSNLPTVEALSETVREAHARGITVHLTMNAFYTASQYPVITAELNDFLATGVDVLIVADLGLMLYLREQGITTPIHASTGCTIFNPEAARFFSDLGAKRIVLPRHVQPWEAADMVKENPGMDFEVFIMNRGCKNIDGFCTFQHGVNEVKYGKLWDIPKKLNIDQLVLGIMRRIPRKMALALLKGNPFSSVGACFLEYDVSLVSTTESDAAKMERARSFIANTFNLLTGVDTCGACALYDLLHAGIAGIKIVGRSNTTIKKVTDVTFLRGCLDYLEERQSAREEARNTYKEWARGWFKEVYGVDCGFGCYWPELMAKAARDGKACAGCPGCGKT